MKIKCAKQDFIESLQSVQGIVGAKAPIQILSNVLLEAEGKDLLLTATDLEVGIRRRIPAKVERKGAITLHAKRLLSILRELPVAEVALEATDGKDAEIRYDASYFKMFCLPKDDFPKLPQFDKGGALKLPRGPLADLIRKTHYAVSHDESRYVLNGLYLLLSKGSARGVATDGRRLALCDIPADIPEGEDRGSSSLQRRSLNSAGSSSGRRPRRGRRRGGIRCRCFSARRRPRFRWATARWSPDWWRATSRTTSR